MARAQAASHPSHLSAIDALEGFDRTAAEQALENLAQALRVLEMAPCDRSELVPHPLVIVRAEIENARRSLVGASAAVQAYRGA